MKNYRLKQRFGKRSNTVYGGKDANHELSLNPSNPKGYIGLITKKKSFVPHRYSKLHCYKDQYIPSY